MIPRDTTAEAHRVQIDILRRMTPEKRLGKGFELMQASRALLETGVRQRHPEYTDTEVHLAVIRLQLPEELFLHAYPHAAQVLP